MKYFMLVIMLMNPMIIFSNNNHSIVNVSDTPSARLPYSGNASRAISLNKVGMKFYYRKQLRRALTYFLAAAKADKTYYWAWFNAACVHARLGQKDKAFSCLKTSISLNNWLRLDAFSDGDLKSLHGDPRFAKLKEKQVMHLRSRINGGWIGLRWGLLKLVLSKNGSFYFQSAESVYEKFKGRFVIKGKNIRFHLTNGTTQVVPILKQSLALVIKFNFSKKETIRFLLKPNLSSSEYEIAKRWARKRYRFFNKIFTKKLTGYYQEPSNQLRLKLGIFGEYEYTTPNKYFTGLYSIKYGKIYLDNGKIINPRRWNH